jgi:hypothetical protein
MKKLALSFCTAALIAAAAPSAHADVRVGMLRCDVAPGVSFIVGSQKQLLCTYEAANGHREGYAGHITRVGIDLGFTTGGQIAWAVYAATRPGPGALAGSYLGASAEATVGAGVGANALVGGFNNSITLQPLSVGAQGGLDVALTGSGLQLDWIKASRGRAKRR